MRRGAGAPGNPGKRLIPLAGSGALLELWPNEGADPVLFFPGSTLAPGHYAVFMRALNDAGFSAAGVHFSGHGQARGRAAPDFEGLLDEGGLAEEWLLREYGRAIIGGHSQGGIIALARAGVSEKASAAFSIGAVFPEAEEAIELTIYAPFRRRRRGLLRIIAKLASLAPSFPVPLPFYLPFRKLVAGKASPVFMGEERGRSTYPLRYLASLFQARIAASLNCPYYLFAAQNDALFTEKIMRATFQRIQAPKKEYAPLPDGGHLACFNPRLAAFISRKMASVAAGLGLALRLRSAGMDDAASR